MILSNIYFLPCLLPTKAEYAGEPSVAVHREGVDLITDKMYLVLVTELHEIHHQLAGVHNSQWVAGVTEEEAGHLSSRTQLMLDLFLNTTDCQLKRLFPFWAEYS